MCARRVIGPANGELRGRDRRAHLRSPEIRQPLQNRSVECESAGDSTDGEQPDERDESNQLGAYFLCRKAAPEEESLSAHRLHASVLRFSDTSTPAICKTERHRAGSSGAGSPGFVRHKTSASSRPNQNGSTVPDTGSFTHTKVTC